jgi:hypothetical protein
MRLRTCFPAIFVLTLFILPLSATGPHQSPSTQPDAQLGQQQRRDEPVVPPEIERKMARDRATIRYQSLKRDSEKLLELATELKQYVDKSGESVLSMDVIKKCDEIEKLSKSVRNKMKGQ